jgi:hypothetical protein
MQRTNYLLFIDECGTHDMRFVDPDFPIFVLVGLLVGELYYAKTLVPRVKQLKRIHLPDPNAHLHSRDIRRCHGAFKFLQNSQERKQRFYETINQLFLMSRFRIFAVAIDKARLLRHSLLPLNPYDVSLSQLLSLVCGPPRGVVASRPLIRRMIAESRGGREDRQLQHEYQGLRRFGFSSYGSSFVQRRKPTTVQQLFPPRIEFATKAHAVTGLELADLAAYPIARAVLADDWSNPAAAVVARKLKALVQFP